MIVYVDTSFFVSLYVQDVHSPKAWALMNSKPVISLTPLHSAEFFHAIARQVFVCRITRSDANSVYDDFRRDKNAGLWFEAPLPERSLEMCEELGRRYGQTIGIRTLDSLHVACALELKAERFWTYDERQAKLARAEGLKIT